jgi:glycosyltransferase involved in cell wall biosynthesis
MREGSSQALPFFPGRLGVQQRVLPAYRARFFEFLSGACQGGLSVFAGQPRSGESIPSAEGLAGARLVPAHNRHFLNVSSPFYLCWQDGLLKWLADWQPDALIVEGNPRYLSTRRAVSWMHRHVRPVIAWGLGAPPFSGPLSNLRRPGRVRFLHSFDALIAYSQRGAAEYRDLGIPPSRVFVAPNAAVPRPDRPPPDRPPGYNEVPTVLFVGRLQSRKRIDNLLYACAALPSDLQPRLWVVGDGPARDEFQALAASVYPRAEFPGSRHGPELEPFFASADLFVLPGTGGLAVQEAMAYGLPVIVAKGDGTQDDLVRPANGWHVPPGDLPELTETLHTALSDVARLRQMGLESYRIVSEEVNLEIMVRVFVQALQAVKQAA